MCESFGEVSRLSSVCAILNKTGNNVYLPFLTSSDVFEIFYPLDGVCNPGLFSWAVRALFFLWLVVLEIHSWFLAPLGNAAFLMVFSLILISYLFLLVHKMDRLKNEMIFCSDWHPVYIFFQEQGSKWAKASGADIKPFLPPPPPYSKYFLTRYILHDLRNDQI